MPSLADVPLAGFPVTSQPELGSGTSSLALNFRMADHPLGTTFRPASLVQRLYLNWPHFSQLVKR